MLSRLRLDVAALLASAVVAPESAAQQQAPLFNLVEELRITSDESSRERSLTLVSDVAVLPDGSMALFHGRRITFRDGITAIRGSGGTTTEHLIRLFDPTGRFVRILGGPGEGPGEFRGLGYGGTVGEHLWAIDYSSGRETVISRDGRVVSTSTQPGRLRESVHKVVGLMGGDRRLVSHRYAPPLPPDPSTSSWQSDSIVFTLEDSTGRRITRIASNPTHRYRVIDARLDGLRWRQDQILAGTVWTAVGEGGVQAVVASDASTWGGRPGQLRLHIVSTDGQVVQQDISFAPQQVPRNYVDSLLGATREPSRSQMRAELQKGLHVPEYFPVLNARTSQQNPLLLGRDGSVWFTPFYESDIWRGGGWPRSNARSRAGGSASDGCIAHQCVGSIGDRGRIAGCSEILGGSRPAVVVK